ncbi:MAG TPA: hypothetical protein VM536_15215 [Chloroflexia bacterium]|nr:hypothetical protein [Chloroflexia bacterium]
MKFPLAPAQGTLLPHVAPIQPSQAVTTTAEVTTTAASGVAPPITPGAIQPQPMAGNPFSPDYLGQAAQPGFGPFSLLYLLISLAVLAGGVYLYFVGKRRWHRVHKLNYRLANFWGVVGMTLGGFGVLFYLFRMLQVEGLNLRFWPYLMLLVMLGFAVYAFLFFRTTVLPQSYATQLAKYMAKAKPVSAIKARAQAPRPGNPAAAARTPGSAGNPRGTSTRGERRREKK